MTIPLKPSLDEVCSFLEKHQALVVHCSGTPKGIGPGVQAYPEDLRKVWLGHASGGISCSLVKPGDQFHGERRHCTGSVGLVVALTEPNSLIAVAPHDAGSWVENGRRLVAREVDIGAADLECSLTERGDRYNEWVVRDFEVVGVFVAEPAMTWQVVDMPMPSGLADTPCLPVGQEVHISIHQIEGDFTGLPIYTCIEGKILRWTENGWSSAAHSDIYDRDLSKSDQSFV